jgi:hypothetical protein
MTALAWSSWSPLDDRGARLSVPRAQGLYRVRIVGESGLVYVGQTTGLRGRLGQLRALYEDDMPYNDPHTAAPCLWVMRTEGQAAFEFSVAEFDGAGRARRAAECVLISKNRAKYGCSPTANFGRMPDGWVKSTGNNAALVRAGRRQRGFRDPSALRSADEPAVLDLHRSPTAADWAELVWSPWSPMQNAGLVTGVYRVRRVGEESLTYIGQGLVRARLAAHAAKGRREAHRQHEGFRGAVQCSWADLTGRSKVQRLEIECDLLASHILMTGSAPAAQFLG